MFRELVTFEGLLVTQICLFSSAISALSLLIVSSFALTLRVSSMIVAFCNISALLINVALWVNAFTISAWVMLSISSVVQVGVLGIFLMIVFVASQNSSTLICCRQP